MSSTNELQTTSMKLTAGTEYLVYLSEPSSRKADELIYPSSAYGFVLNPKSGEVIPIGGSKHLKLFGKRSIQHACSLQSESFSLNGVKHSLSGFHSHSDQLGKCFAKLDVGCVQLEGVNDGFYCIDNKVLYEFKGISKNKNVKVREDKEGHLYMETSKSNLKAIILNGKKVNDGEGIVIGDNKIVFTGLTPTENLYLEHNDGTFSDAQLTKPIQLGKFFFPKTFSGEFNFTENYRGTVIKTTPISYTGTSTTKASITFTRPDNETLDLEAFCVWQGDIESVVRERHFEVVHPNQKTKINYSLVCQSLTDKRSIAKVEVLEGDASVEDLSVSFKSWKTVVKCLMNDGTSCSSTLYRNQKPFSIKTQPTVRFEEGEVLGLFKTDGFYIIDDEVFEESTKGKTAETTFTEYESLMIKPQKGVINYGTYSDATGEWTIYPLKLKCKFNKVYIREVYSTVKEHFQLSSFGICDFKDEWTYFANGRQLDNLRWKVSVPKEIKSGSLIEEVKFTAKNTDGETYDFLAKFFFETKRNVSFILSGDAYFSNPTYKRVSFNSKPLLDEPFFTYGNFRSPKDEVLYALNNEVTSETTTANTYPVVLFLEPSIGLLRTTDETLPITTLSLIDDLTITGVQQFIRLNNCNDVVFENSTIKIPSNTGVAFFRAIVAPVIEEAEDRLYLVRSSLTRSVSFSALESNIKTPKATSQPSSPREDEYSSASATSPPRNQIKNQAFQPSPSELRQTVPLRTQPTLVNATTTPVTQLKASPQPQTLAQPPTRMFLPPPPPQQIQVSAKKATNRTNQSSQRTSQPRPNAVAYSGRVVKQTTPSQASTKPSQASINAKPNQSSQMTRPSSSNQMHVLASSPTNYSPVLAMVASTPKNLKLAYGKPVPSQSSAVKPKASKSVGAKTSTTKPNVSRVPHPSKVKSLQPVKPVSNRLF